MSEEDFLIACEYGDCEFVEECLREGMDVNVQDCLPLRIAVSRGQQGVVNILLRYKARMVYGFSSLENSLVADKDEVIKILLNFGIGDNFPSDVIDMMIRYGRNNLILEFLQRNLNVHLYDIFMYNWIGDEGKDRGHEYILENLILRAIEDEIDDKKIIDFLGDAFVRFKGYRKKFYSDTYRSDFQNKYFVKPGEWVCKCIIRMGYWNDILDPVEYVSLLDERHEKYFFEKRDKRFMKIIKKERDRKIRMKEYPGDILFIFLRESV